MHIAEKLLYRGNCRDFAAFYRGEKLLEGRFGQEKPCKVNPFAPTARLCRHEPFPHLGNGTEIAPLESFDDRVAHEFAYRDVVIFEGAAQR